MLAGMKSEQVAGFVSESMAGFIGIRMLCELMLKSIEVSEFKLRVEGAC